MQHVWTAIYTTIPATAVLVFLLRWFLLRTDVMVSYNWAYEGRNFHPSFDIRNRSSSRTYVLGNIKYTKNNGQEIVGFDNKSFSGHEMKPGTIHYLEVAPVPNVHSLAECLQVEVTVRLQNEREFKGQGPGQLYRGRRKAAFELRRRLEKISLPISS
jgi:hypothetical protein